MILLGFQAALLAILFWPIGVASVDSSGPSVTVKNGSYVGKNVPEWKQDHFLGMPYAKAPIGSLRFARPLSLTDSFTGTRDATEYGASCYQYGTNFTLSEDCLTLNVIRPAGTTASSKLPVLVWIYGGGLTLGATADPQYNLSGITSVGQQNEKPIITVSMNYRLGVWGFLQTPQILAEGSSNAGLLDQRLALRWVQENIQAFGGDPQKVVVWGESAGAQSIGLHLHSYGGRDDGLFRAAIMESGSSTGISLSPLGFYTNPVENLTRTTNCYTALNQLACLRSLTSEELYKAQVSQVWNPVVDGDFLTDYPSNLMAQEKFIHVPLLVGANTDEGTSFGVAGLDNETAIFNSLLYYRRGSTYAISPPSARKLLDLYPDDPTNEPPYYVTDATVFPGKGLAWRRDCAIAGDIVIIAGRRKLCERYTSARLPVFSYRFDTPLWNADASAGAQHFANVVFSFQNISGALGPLPTYQSYATLSNSIGKAYISFVNDLNPDSSKGKSSLPDWPVYNVDTPQNMVLNSNASFVEKDTWRSEGIAFLNTIDRELCS